MIEAEKVGARIKQNREQANLTQDALAKQLNVSRQSVSEWEKGGGLVTCYWPSSPNEWII